MQIMSDEMYMRRAIRLAALGGVHVQPNPMVGCVLVANNKVIGEGWHKRFGGAHAEVEAINSVRERHLLQGATAYVSLEPCAHYAKTAPCSKALIDVKLRRVVIGCVDPNPKVQGRGIEALEKAGIEVRTKVLEADAQHINRRFFTFIQQQRPYIILKWAESRDKYMAPPRGIGPRPYWLSHPCSRRLAHLWRTQEAAILVGARTAFEDNPRLTVRLVEGPQPLRVLLDSSGRLSSSLLVWNQEALTLAYTSAARASASYISISEANFFEDMLLDLYHRDVSSLIVEGGAYTLKSFLDRGFWDEIRVIRGGRLRRGYAAPSIPQEARLYRCFSLHKDIICTYLRLFDQQ